jgi:hypothetical protein
MTTARLLPRHSRRRLPMRRRALSPARA